MADTQAQPSGTPNPGPAKPPLAVVGSQISQDEKLFGQVFDKWVVRRFLTYLTPYRGELYMAVGAVLVFTMTQLSIPLIIRAVIDDAYDKANTTTRASNALLTVGVGVVGAGGWLLFTAADGVQQVVAVPGVLALRGSF